VRQCAPCRTVLEIGCGDGAILGKLAKAGKAVTGVDADKTALKLAREMFARHGLQGEFCSELREVKETQFDAIILAEVIEHVEDAKDLLDEAVKKLSTQGRLILTTPIRLLEHSLDVHHVHEFWPWELEQLLRNYFDDVRLVRMHPAWLVDLMCWGFGRVRPAAVCANLLKLCTGVELLDACPSPLSIYWTQGVVATRLKRHSPRIS
jgi:SAM-dependent methyltransferase